MNIKFYIILYFFSRTKFAHGVLSGKYSAAPAKESQETTEQQTDQVVTVQGWSISDISLKYLTASAENKDCENKN